LWTWEEWTQTGSQIREDVAQSPKTPLISGLADISLIGSAKGLVEAATGEDLLTREPLPWWRRGLSLLCLSEFRGVGRLGVVADALEEGGSALSRVGRLGVVANALEEGESALPLASRGKVVMDANALINGLEKGELEAVDRALAGRTPVISITAAKEFLRKGDVNVLREFLVAREGRIGLAATEQQIADLRVQADILGRALLYRDAATAGTAINEAAPVLTRDEKFLRFLKAVGLPVEKY